MPAVSIERKKRKAARVALYASLVTMVMVIGVLGKFTEWAVRPERRWGEQDLSGRPEVELLREYVRIDTRSGKEIDGARFLAAKLAEAGIEATIEPLGDGRANLWAILEGRNPEALVLHHHMDVWSIDNAELWLHPPFAAELEGPWLYGRGTFDMKSYGVAQLLAFLDAARRQQPLERSLILLATSDEESGSVLGTRWVLAKHPELAARFWGVLTEGGVVEALNPEVIKYWGVETQQLRILFVDLCSPSRERLENLVADLHEWPANEIVLRLTEAFEDFAADYGPSRSRRLTRINLNIPEVVLRHRKGFRYLPHYLQSLLSDGIEAREITAGENGFEVRLTVFLLPGSDPESVVARLLPNWLIHGLSVTVGEPIGASFGSPQEHPLFVAAIDSLLRAYPEANAGSFFLANTITDSRFFRELGIPSYGYSPFLFFTTDTMWVDRNNERIPLPGFLSGVRIYSDLVGKIVSGPSGDNPLSGH